MQLSKDSIPKFDFMSGSVKNIQETLASAHKDSQKKNQRNEKELVQYQNEICLLKKEFGDLQSTLANACQKIKMYENIFEKIENGKNKGVLLRSSHGEFQNYGVENKVEKKI
jgi:hypothetical protein